MLQLAVHTNLETFQCIGLAGFGGHLHQLSVHVHSAADDYGISGNLRNGGYDLRVLTRGPGVIGV